jgi:hypothetical protein
VRLRVCVLVQHVQFILSLHGTTHVVPVLFAATTLQAAAETMRAIKARETLLAPVFMQLAHAFADLHDTPGRMVAKGCISRIVPWQAARRELFVRLRRRLNEASFCRRVVATIPGVTALQVWLRYTAPLLCCL